MGNECIALGAIHSGATAVYAYPGTPSSEILTAFQKMAPDRYAQWSINEKIALELAVAEAITGKFVMCVMKQVGLNVAADPLFSAAYTGIKGALVIVSADDPGPYSSQTEQDSRMYAVSAKIPVFDPANPVDAKMLTQKAFKLSHQYEVPVLIRPVMRVCHSRQNINVNDQEYELAQPELKFNKNPQRWAATPAFRKKLHQVLIEKLQGIENEDHVEIPAKHNNVVIVSGYAYSLVSDAIKEKQYPLDVIKLDMPFPLANKWVTEIEDAYENILIIEETFPVMENQFIQKSKIWGKWNDMVPCRGELTLDIVEPILNKLIEKPFTKKANMSLEAPKPAKPRLCAGCGHRAAFYAIKKAARTGIFPSDIGCYTLGSNLKAVDTVFVMGAAVSFAEGLKRSNPNRPVVATIGDSTFFHTGIPALINAYINKSPVTIAILDNATTAMTGFQPVPHEVSDINIEKLVKGIGIDFVETIDPYFLKDSIDLVKKAVSYSEEAQSPAVIIFKHSCVTQLKEKGKQNVYINEDCDNCGICDKNFECPAIFYDDSSDKTEIDQALCNLCGVCIEVCPKEAIEVK